MKSTDNLELVISAKDLATSKLQGLKSSVIGIGAAFLSWQTAKAAFSWIAVGGAEAEKQTIRLAASIQRVGFSSAGILPVMESLASKLQQQAGIDDEIAKGAIVRLIDANIRLDKIQRVLAAAADLAAAKEMDLGSAAELLAKASLGATETLTRYGIVLDANLPKAEKFEAALKQIEQRFGGSAAAQMESHLRKWDRFKLAIGDVGEALFSSATESGFFARAIDNASKRAEAFGTIVSKGGFMRGMQMVWVSLQSIVSGKTIKQATDEFVGMANALNNVDQSAINAASSLQATRTAMLARAKEEDQIFLDAGEAAYRSSFELFTEKGQGSAGFKLRDLTPKIDVAAVKGDFDDIIAEMEAAKQKAQEYADMFAYGFTNAIGDVIKQLLFMEKSFEEIMRNMAKSFISLFVDAIMKALAEKLSKQFLKLFMFWDVAANDRALIREGQRAASFIQQGLTQGMRGFNIDPSLLGFAVAGGPRRSFPWQSYDAYSQFEPSPYRGFVEQFQRDARAGLIYVDFASSEKSTRNSRYGRSKTVRF